MKKIFLSLCILFIAIVGLYAQCTPDFTRTIPGLYPPPDSFPCVDQGVALTSTVMTIKNFNTAGPGGAYTVDSIQIDSLTNVPCGISYSVYYVNGRKIRNNEAGCINFTGTTNVPVGQYQMHVFGTIWGSPDIQLGIEGESKDLSVIGNLNSPPLDFRYWMRVKASADTCTTLDKSTSSTKNKTANCGTSSISDQNVNLSALMIYPNPADQFTTLSLSSSENASYTLIITNIIGETVLSKDVQIEIGDNKLSLNLHGFAKGNYVATLKGNTGNVSMRFVVE